MDRSEATVKILNLIFPGFTFIDLAGPLQTFSLLPEAQTQFVWQERGPVPSDAGAVVTATHTFADAWDDVDVLFVPGNSTALYRLLHDRPTAEFLADRGSRAGWVTSVCNGSLLLGTAGLLNGYEAASHWYTRDLLTRYGAVPKAERVVIDRNRVTGGGMTAGIDFGLTLLGTIVGPELGRVAELLFEYAPQPPFGTGRPELADAATLESARTLLADPTLASVPEGPLVASVHVATGAPRNVRR